MHGVFIGASKGIGYHAAIHFLESNTANTATLLLRKPSVGEQDARLGPLIRDGRISVVQGDATKLSDVQAAVQGKVDFVVSSVG